MNNTKKYIYLYHLGSVFCDIIEVSENWNNFLRDIKKFDSGLLIEQKESLLEKSITCYQCLEKYNLYNSNIKRGIFDLATQDFKLQKIHSTPTVENFEKYEFHFHFVSDELLSIEKIDKKLSGMLNNLENKKISDIVINIKENFYKNITFQNVFINRIKKFFYKKYKNEIVKIIDLSEYKEMI